MTQTSATSRTSSRPLIPSREAARAIAADLCETLRSRAQKADEDRRLPDATIAELLDSGLFQLLTPRRLGGSEVGFAALFEVTTQLASACGATGWVYGVLAGHSWMLHLFPEQAQREIFSDSDALTATVFRLGGDVAEVDGGFRITDGEGRFCSGVDFVSWVIVGGAATKPDGTKEPRFFVIPRSDFEIVDDWHTSGMRGTGSRSIRVRDAFVPAHRSLTIQQMQSGDAPGQSFNPGPLYRHSFAYVTPFSIVGAPIGMAKGALAAAVDATGLKGREPATEQQPTVVQLAEAASAIDAAYNLVLRDAEQVDRAMRAEEVSADDRVRIPRNWAYAVQTARRAANQAFEVAGGSSIYQSSAAQRFWRDVNASAQHRAFAWNPAMGDYGRTMLGLEPSGYKLKTR